MKYIKNKSKNKTKNCRSKLTIKINEDLQTQRNSNIQKYIFSFHRNPTHGGRGNYPK